MIQGDLRGEIPLAQRRSLKPNRCSDRFRGGEGHDETP